LKEKNVKKLLIYGIFVSLLFANFCEIGKNQSPVNLSNFIEAKLPKLKIVYSGNIYSIVKSKKRLKAKTGGNNFIEIDKKRYFLREIKFFIPSEHKINGKSFRLEGEFIHKSRKGEYAVISVMFEKGEPNSGINKMIYQIPKTDGENRKLIEMFNPGEFFPKKLDYFRYCGSLTEKPCEEGVIWIVLKKNSFISEKQLEKLYFLKNNNRALQPLNGRVILK